MQLVPHQMKRSLVCMIFNYRCRTQHLKTLKLQERENAVCPIFMPDYLRFGSNEAG